MQGVGGWGMQETPGQELKKENVCSTERRGPSHPCVPGLAEPQKHLERRRATVHPLPRPCPPNAPPPAVRPI